MQWNGKPTCTSSACTIPTTGTSAQSEAHKGYAVRLVSDAGSPAPYLGTLGASAGSTTNSLSACPTTTPTCGTISSMDDMTVFTPVNGATRHSSRSRSSASIRRPTPARRSTSTCSTSVTSTVARHMWGYRNRTEPGRRSTASPTSERLSEGRVRPAAGGVAVPVAWPSGGCMHRVLPDRRFGVAPSTTVSGSSCR